MKQHYDFSKGERGKFSNPDAVFKLPVYLDEQVQGYLSAKADAKGDDNAGPARYWQASGYDSRIGFISPHSNNFCSSCNRVRVTATGRLLLCLGQENSVDLREALRTSEDPQQEVRTRIINAMHHKPEKHTFDLADEPQIVRFMNMTGG